MPDPKYTDAAEIRTEALEELNAVKEALEHLVGAVEKPTEVSMGFDSPPEYANDEDHHLAHALFDAEAALALMPALIEQAEAMQWKPIETAPINQRVIVWGGAGIRFGIMDNLGNWRDGFNFRHKVKPSYWMPRPAAPSKQEAE